MVIYDESKNYAGVIMDDEAKESEDNGSRCEDLYVRFAKAIRKEERKGEHVRQAARRRRRRAGLADSVHKRGVGALPVADSAGTSNGYSITPRQAMRLAATPSSARTTVSS